MEKHEIFQTVMLRENKIQQLEITFDKVNKLNMYTIGYIYIIY